MDYEKEISFGAFDSELMHQEIYIPEGFEATIDGDKIILTRKDSEDEKIRKALIEYFNEQCDMSDWNGVYGYQVVAWLEKQGEHKKFRDSIQVGDEVTRNSDGVIVNLSQLKRVAKKSEQKLPIEKLPEKMKTIGESLGFTTQEECDEYNEMVSDLIMSDNKVKPKFHEGEWVVFNDKHESVYQIEKIENFQYTLRHILGGSMPLSFSGEDMIRPWAIQDAKDGDVLACNEEILLFKSYSVQGRISLYCWYNGQTNNFHSKEVVDTLMTTRNKIYPATKEQRDILFQKMKEEGYEWDDDKKVLMKIEKNTDVNHEYFSELLENDDSKDINYYAYQVAYCMSHDWLEETATWEDVQKAVKLGAEWQKQKLTWSEEDEEIRKWIINEIKIKHHNLDEDNVDFVDKAIAWLEKQCKETSWKPSKEEMDVLYGLAYITNQYDEHKEEVITRLYQDLKREFFNSSSYENMFPNTQDGVRRRSTIQVLEYARSLDNYNQYGKADIDKNIAWLEKQGVQKPILNVPPREVILSIWDLGNEWKELTNGSISTEYGTQLSYIQKHWHESEYYLREKQGEQKPTDEDMKEALRTEYEKGRADAIAEMRKKLSDSKSKRQEVIRFLESLRLKED